MTIKDCEKNRICEIISVNVVDGKIKLRLYEIGFFPYSQIEVLNISTLKKTMLVKVLDSCFALKSHIAECIEVKYV